MIKDIIRRVTAGMLSTITMLSSTPLSCALDFGPIARAEEDNIQHGHGQPPAHGEENVRTCLQ